MPVITDQEKLSNPLVSRPWQLDSFRSSSTPPYHLHVFQTGPQAEDAQKYGSQSSRSTASNRSLRSSKSTGLFRPGFWSRGELAPFPMSSSDKIDLHPEQTPLKAKDSSDSIGKTTLHVPTHHLLPPIPNASLENLFEYQHSNQSNVSNISESTVISRRHSLTSLEPLKKRTEIVENVRQANLPRGVLQIDLLNIRLFPPPQKPYVRLRLGAQVYASSTADSSSGEWNEGFRFWVSFHSQLFDVIEIASLTYMTGEGIGGPKYITLQKADYVLGTSNRNPRFVPLHEYKTFHNRVPDWLIPKKPVPAKRSLDSLPSWFSASSPSLLSKKDTEGSETNEEVQSAYEETLHSYSNARHAIKPNRPSKLRIPANNIIDNEMTVSPQSLSPRDDSLEEVRHTSPPEPSVERKSASQELPPHKRPNFLRRRTSETSTSSRSSTAPLVPKRKVVGSVQIRVRYAYQKPRTARRVSMRKEAQDLPWEWGQLLKEETSRNLSSEEKAILSKTETPVIIKKHSPEDTPDDRDTTKTNTLSAPALLRTVSSTSSLSVNTDEVVVRRNSLVDFQFTCNLADALAEEHAKEQQQDRDPQTQRHDDADPVTATAYDATSRTAADYGFQQEDLEMDSEQLPDEFGEPALRSKDGSQHKPELSRTPSSSTDKASTAYARSIRQSNSFLRNLSVGRWGWTKKPPKPRERFPELHRKWRDKNYAPSWLEGSDSSSEEPNRHSMFHRRNKKEPNKKQDGGEKTMETSTQKQRDTETTALDMLEAVAKANGERSGENNVVSHPRVDWMLGFVVSHQTRLLIRAVTRLAATFGQGFKVNYTQAWTAWIVLEKYYAQVVASAHSTLPPNREVNDLQFVDMAWHYYKYSLVSYGWRVLPFLGKYARNIKAFEATWSRSNRDFIKNYLNIPYEDILGYEYGIRRGSVFHPSYFVAVDKWSEAIVLTIRGTWSLYDAITDLVCEYRPWRGGVAHSGMLASAQWFFINIVPHIFHYLRNRHDNINKFIITGHSLGAGSGALLTMMVLDHLDTLRALTNNPNFKVHCYAYAPVPVTNLELAERYKDHIDSFVAQDDIVVRMSYGTAMQTRELVMDAISVVEAVGGYHKWNTDEEARERCFRFLDDKRELYHMEGRKIFPVLYLPGKVYQFVRYAEATKGKHKEDAPNDASDSLQNNRHISLFQSDSHISEEILIAKTSIDDHMVLSYLSCFDQVRHACMRGDRRNGSHKTNPSSHVQR